MSTIGLRGIVSAVTKMLVPVGILAIVAVFGMSQTVTALSPKQRGLFRAGVPYFNVDKTAPCGSGSTTGGTTGSGTVTTDLASFIDAYGQIAFDIGKKNGIPYDAILAQASVESGNGQSQLTREANNFFGIKAGSSWTGATITMRTAEQTSSGSVYYVNAKFRAYPSPAAGFQGYVDFLKSNPRYATALQQRDPIAYFQALKAAGYATDTRYVEILSSRLSAVQQYIASKNLFPPSSQVVYDTPAPGAGTTGTPASTCTPGGGASVNGSNVAAIAIAEAQAWAQGGISYTKYTDGRAENWCADFVSWVYRAAGSPFTAAPGVVLVNGWQIPAVSSLQTYLTIKGTYWPKASAPEPQPGDIVIYKNGASHTNIVVEANGYMVKTVGGNQGGGGGQGAFYTTSDVTMSKAFFDIRNDATVSGWGRLQ